MPPQPKKRPTLADIRLRFHLPLNEAAKDLGICQTLLKKFCRQYNINRWPYRKIKSLDRKLVFLKSAAENTSTCYDEVQEYIQKSKGEKETATYNPPKNEDEDSVSGSESSLDHFGRAEGTALEDRFKQIQTEIHYNNAMREMILNNEYAGDFPGMTSHQLVLTPQQLQQQQQAPQQVPQSYFPQQQQHHHHQVPQVPQPEPFCNPTIINDHMPPNLSHFGGQQTCATSSATTPDYHDDFSSEAVTPSSAESFQSMLFGSCALGDLGKQHSFRPSNNEQYFISNEQQLQLQSFLHHRRQHSFPQQHRIPRGPTRASPQLPVSAAPPRRLPEPLSIPNPPRHSALHVRPPGTANELPTANDLPTEPSGYQARIQQQQLQHQFELQQQLIKEQQQVSSSAMPLPNQGQFEIPNIYSPQRTQQQQAVLSTSAVEESPSGLLPSLTDVLGSMFFDSTCQTLTPVPKQPSAATSATAETTNPCVSTSTGVGSSSCSGHFALDDVLMSPTSAKTTSALDLEHPDKIPNSEDDFFAELMARRYSAPALFSSPSAGYGSSVAPFSEQQQQQNPFADLASLFFCGNNKTAQQEETDEHATGAALSMMLEPPQQQQQQQQQQLYAPDVALLASVATHHPSSHQKPAIIARSQSQQPLDTYKRHQLDEQQQYQHQHFAQLPMMAVSGAPHCTTTSSSSCSNSINNNAAALDSLNNRHRAGGTCSPPSPSTTRLLHNNSPMLTSS